MHFTTPRSAALRTEYFIVTASPPMLVNAKQFQPHHRNVPHHRGRDKFISGALSMLLYRLAKPSNLDICPICSTLARVSIPSQSRLSSSSTSTPKDFPSIRESHTALKNGYFFANSIARKTFRRFRKESWRDFLLSPASVARKTSSNLNNKDLKSNSLLNSLDSTARKPSLEKPDRISSGTQDKASEGHVIPFDASSRLSDLSSKLPPRSLRRLLALYLSLSKPRLTFLVVLTTATTYSLYPVPDLLLPLSADTSSLSTLTLAFLLAGTGLSSASANAFNMLIEPSHDAKMSRTRNRPLVRGLISSKGALVFALATGLTGIFTLYYGVNPTVAKLGAANIILYAGPYTLLKRISVMNTWIGALVGGIPPLMGWAAAAGHFNTSDCSWHDLLLGERNVGGWLIALLLFAWQFPHFNALSWSARDEYRNAGYRMLAWTNQAMNGRVALRYSILMFPVCIGLAASGVTDWAFVGTSSIANGWMCWHAARFWWKNGAHGSARGLFWASVWHLPIVLVLAMAHKKGLWERLLGVVSVSRKSEELEEQSNEPIRNVLQILDK